jgi:hypothetical protein
MMYLCFYLAGFFIQFDRELPLELGQFIPDGYVALGHAYGDLNKDKKDDVILILKNMDEEKTSDVNANVEARPLLIILRQKDGSLKQVARNDSVVLCYNCGGAFGDPYAGISIKNGYFSIEHYGGSSWKWERVITFKYDKKANNWFLHRDGTIRYQPSNEIGGEEILTTKDFGKVEFEKFRVYTDQ